MERAIREPTHVSGFAFPDQCGLVGCRALEVTVEAVEGEVGGATFEPTGKRWIGPIENRVEWLEPVQFLACRLTPEGIGVLTGGIRQCPIGLQAADAGVG